MTEFNYTPAKIFVEAEKEYKSIKHFDVCNDFHCKTMLTVLRSTSARIEARWRWLAENQKDIFLIKLETEDLDYAICNVLRFFDSNLNVVYEQNWGLGDRRAAKRLKSKLKWFGIDYENKLRIDILH